MKSLNLHQCATRTGPLTAVLAVLLAASACGTTPERNGRADGQPAGVVLTDPMVAGAFVTANTGEVEASRLALQKSQNAQVRQFAERMISDHTYVIQQTTSLARDREISMQTSALTEELQRSLRATVSNLGQHEGSAFDRAYMENQVALHRYLLQLLDATLIPSARSDALEQLLAGTRPIIAEHLRMAEAIVGRLEG